MSLTLIDRWIKMIHQRCRALVGLVVCLAVGLGFPVWSGAAPAASGVDMAIVSGFDGKCKLGGLNPVLVEVEAGDNSCEGVLKLKAGTRTYSTRVELERGARKMIRFSVPLFGADDRIEVVFEDGTGTPARTEHNPAIMPENTLFIGVLSDSPGHLDDLQDIDTTGLGGGGIAMVLLDRQLPYSLEELESINVIMIEDFNTAELDGQGTELLKDWVGLGNCLLAGAGDSAHKTLTGLLDSLEGPVYYGDGVMVPVAGGIAGNTPEFLGDVLTGQITPHALAKAVNGSGLQQQGAGAAKLNGVAEEALRPEQNTIYFLFSLLALYLVVVAAAAMARKRWPWTYGAVVALGSLLFLGLSLHSGIFKAAAGGAGVKVHGPVTRAWALTCVYPCGDGGVNIKIPGVTFAWLQSGDWEADPRSGEVRTTGGTGLYLYTSSYAPGGTDSLTLTVDGDGTLTGEIVNPLFDTLENCLLLVGDTVIPVGDMEGREKLSVQYRLDHNLTGTGDYNYLDLLCRVAGVGEQRRQLVDYYCNNLADYRPGGRLMGFARETAEAEINSDHHKFTRTVLNVFNIDLQPGGEDGLHLPPEVVKPVIDYNQAAGAALSREYPGAGESGELKLYYVLPPGLQPMEISFTGFPWSDGNTIAVYNRTTGRWERIAGKKLAGEKLRDYIAGGPLVLSVSGGARALMPQVAVQGVVKQ